jgi:hypothetical protein
MKRVIYKFKSSLFALFLVLFGVPMLAGSACSQLNSQEKIALDWRRGVVQRFHDNLSRPFSERVQQMPADVLKVAQDYDQSLGIANTDRYIAKLPTADELTLLKSYFDLLPSAHQDVFSRKLLAVYLIDGFAGAGLTEWLVDQDGRSYYYMILNRALLTQTLDDWITYKENSQFDQSVTSPTIRVQTNTHYKALMYGLLHEGAHVVDYELGIAPYFDPLHRKIMRRDREETEFTQGIWLHRTKPVFQYDFKHREEMNLYGIFTKMGLIPRSELPAMFSQLKQTPFVSFYGGTSWNEDLADYLTYQYIENKLGGAVTVELLQNGKIIDHYEPVKTPQAKQREKAVRVFYE